MLVLLAWICGREAEDRNEDLMGNTLKKKGDTLLFDSLLEFKQMLIF